MAIAYHGAVNESFPLSAASRERTGAGGKVTFTVLLSPTPNHRQKRIAIGFQLARPHAADLAHRRQAGWPSHSHFAQGGVVEDDVGGQAGLNRKIAAEGAEGVEQGIADGVWNAGG